MKRIAIFVLIALLLIPCLSMADEAEQPEVVVLGVIPTPTPLPAPTPTPDTIPVAIQQHDLDAIDVETLARLLWSSPLRERTQKAALAWLVCNRADSSISGNTITSNINTAEFSFYDRKAHLSEENTEIATLVLNQWLSEKDGYRVGRLVPRSALFLNFSGHNNRELVLYGERGGNALEWPIRDAYDYEGGSK